MLQELTHMDRITQLQDEIQNVRNLRSLVTAHPLIQENIIPQLLMIMANSINYLTTRADFKQVSPQVPITKQRNPEKFDPPDVFEGV
jgi:mediator of RNA polymerase II transcription subunit 21